MWVCWVHVDEGQYAALALDGTHQVVAIVPDLRARRRVAQNARRGGGKHEVDLGFGVILSRVSVFTGWSWGPVAPSEPCGPCGPGTVILVTTNSLPDDIEPLI